MPVNKRLAYQKVYMENECKHKNKYDNSRDLQIWLWSNRPAIKASADFIFNKMKNAGLVNKLNPNRLKNHLKVILTDLYVCHSEDNKRYISISLNRNDYFTPTYFKKIFLNYKYLTLVIKYLTEQKYIEFKRGFYSKNGGRKSRIKSSQKLLRLFKKYEKPCGVILSRKPPVILKDSNKNEIDYDFDSPEVRPMIRNINKINKHILEHTIDVLDFTEEVVTENMYKNNNKYHRTFNNSSFQQGGRFYGHWSQNIKSDKRRLITIDNNRTVELDYSCLHISMLYGLIGQTPPEGDLYKLVTIPCEYRKVIKKAVNIALNADNKKSAMAAIYGEIISFCQETGLPFIRPKILLSEIYTVHNDIEQYFCSGYGVILQYYDSYIAEKIMLTLGDEGICCLCIHDSFIISEQYRDRLYDLMMNYFYEIFNFYPKIHLY